MTFFTVIKALDLRQVFRLLLLLLSLRFVVVRLILVIYYINVYKLRIVTCYS